MQLRKPGLSLAVFFVMAFYGWGQQPSPALRISVQGPRVDVALSAQAPLSQVLDAFCHETNTGCEGTELAAGSAVSPLEFKGTASQVLAQLLDGSQLNYVYSPRDGARPARLLIQGLAKTLEAGHPSGNPSASSYSPQTATAGGSQGDTPMVSDSASSPEPPSESSFGAGSESRSSMGGSAFGGNNSMMPAQVPTTGVRGSPLTSDMSEAMASQQAPEFLPFPDSHGNPIPTNNDSPQYLPFPDSNGNPIPVKPSPGGSPFPIQGIPH
jgi:hypothetical protein